MASTVETVIDINSNVAAVNIIASSTRTEVQSQASASPSTGHAEATRVTIVIDGTTSLVVNSSPSKGGTGVTYITQRPLTLTAPNSQGSGSSNGFSTLSSSHQNGAGSGGSSSSAAPSQPSTSGNGFTQRSLTFQGRSSGAADPPPRSNGTARQLLGDLRVQSPARAADCPSHVLRMGNSFMTGSSSHSQAGVLAGDDSTRGHDDQERLNDFTPRITVAERLDDIVDRNSPLKARGEEGDAAGRVPSAQCAGALQEISAVEEATAIATAGEPAHEGTGGSSSKLTASNTPSLSTAEAAKTHHTRGRYTPGQYNMDRYYKYALASGHTRTEVTKAAKTRGPETMQLFTEQPTIAYEQSKLSLPAAQLSNKAGRALASVIDLTTLNQAPPTSKKPGSSTKNTAPARPKAPSADPIVGPGSTGAALTDFTCFTKLSRQVRGTIWKLSFPERRYVWIDPDFCGSSAKAPAALFTCRESRAEALKWYIKDQCVKSLGNEMHSTYLDPLNDTFCLATNYHMGLDNMVHCFKGNEQRISSLAVCLGQGYDRIDDGKLHGLFDGFQGLQDILIMENVYKFGPRRPTLYVVTQQNRFNLDARTIASHALSPAALISILPTGKCRRHRTGWTTQAASKEPRRSSKHGHGVYVCDSSLRIATKWYVSLLTEMHRTWC